MSAPMAGEILGLDEDWSKVDPATAKAQGFHFVVGYVSQDNTGKNITRAQVDALHAAGLDVALVFEYAPQSAVGGSWAGTQDAMIAVQKATALGAPKGMTIYFAIDFPVGSASAEATIGEYMRAASAVCKGGGYHADAYGGIVIIGYLFDAGLIDFGWQTYAWSNGQWDARATLRQMQNHIFVGGATVDRDAAMRPNFGQWRPDGSVGSTGSGFRVGDTMQFLAVRGDQHFLCDGMTSRPISASDADVLAYLATSARGAAVQLARSIDGKNNDEWAPSPGGAVTGIVRLGWVPAMGAVPEAAPAPAPAPVPDPGTPTPPEQSLLDLWGRVADALDVIAVSVAKSAGSVAGASMLAHTATVWSASGADGTQTPVPPPQEDAPATMTPPVDTQP